VLHALRALPRRLVTDWVHFKLDVIALSPVELNPYTFRAYELSS